MSTQIIIFNPRAFLVACHNAINDAHIWQPHLRTAWVRSFHARWPGRIIALPRVLIASRNRDFVCFRAGLLDDFTGFPGGGVNGLTISSLPNEPKRLRRW